MTSSTGGRPVAPRRVVGPFCKELNMTTVLSREHGQLGECRKQEQQRSMYRSGLNGEAPRMTGSFLLPAVRPSDIADLRYVKSNPENT